MQRPQFVFQLRPYINNSDDSGIDSDFVLGVDLGGTKILIMAATLQGEIIAKGLCPTPKTDNLLEMDSLILTISSFVNEICFDLAGLRAIGIGVPGAVDMENGTVSLAPNLGWIDGFQIIDPLCTGFGVPVFVDNDVNMAVIGEKNYGLGRRINNLIFVAVGTGIGAGLIIDGKVYRGANWRAGEIGFMVLDTSCIRKTYQEQGYLELLASGQAILEKAHECKDLSTKNVFVAAAEGDSSAKAIVKEALDGLSLALVNIVAVMDPEMIVLGGGVLENGIVLERIRSTVNRMIPNNVRIELSELGSEAQAYGAIAKAVGLVKTMSTNDNG